MYFEYKCFEREQGIVGSEAGRLCIWEVGGLVYLGKIIQSMKISFALEPTDKVTDKQGYKQGKSLISSVLALRIH